MSVWHEARRKIYDLLISQQKEGYLWGSIFDNAWMGYILSKHKRGHERLIESLKNYLDGWFEREIPSTDRDFASVGLYIRFKANLGYDVVNKKLEELKAKGFILLRKNEKFSLSKSPELFFAFILGGLENKLEYDETCHQILINELKNNWYNSNYRLAFYTAAAFEVKLLDEEYIKKIVRHISSIDVGKINDLEIQALIWLFTTYYEDIKRCFETEGKDVDLLKNKYKSFISEFENMISRRLDIDEEEYHALSVFQLGLYYDIVESLLEIKPDPLQLFENFPIHPIVKKVTYHLFKEGHYYEAVRNASTLYISEVKNRSDQPKDKHGRELDGRKLMQEVFKVDNPILVLNSLKTQSEKDEQEGFMHLSIGTVVGIRNPKAHELDREDPYRALEYIILISMLMKRLIECKKIGQGDTNAKQ